MIQRVQPADRGNRPASRWRRQPTPTSTRRPRPQRRRLRSWTGLGDQGRARALAAVADALDARAGDLVPRWRTKRPH